MMYQISFNNAHFSYINFTLFLKTSFIRTNMSRHVQLFLRKVTQSFDKSKSSSSYLHKRHDFCAFQEVTINTHTYTYTHMVGKHSNVNVSMIHWRSIWGHHTFSSWCESNFTYIHSKCHLCSLYHVRCERWNLICYIKFSHRSKMFCCIPWNERKWTTKTLELIKIFWNSHHGLFQIIVLIYDTTMYCTIEILSNSHYFKFFFRNCLFFFGYSRSKLSE